MEQIKNMSNKLMSNIKTPSLKMPSIKTPSLKMPSIKTPSLKMPSIKTPSLQKPNAVKNIIQKTTTGISPFIGIKDILIIFGIFMGLVVISVVFILSGVSFNLAPSKPIGDTYILEGYDEHEQDMKRVEKKLDEKTAVVYQKK